MAELTWTGKYVDGRKSAPLRVALPFQPVETVNETPEERLKSLNLFTVGKASDWRNRLIWGDKKYVLPSLLPEFAGKVDLIYIDPPFNVGANFSFNATIPESGESFVKEPSIIEMKAYRDTWGRGMDSYLQWFYEGVVILHELLAESGTLYVHLDNHVGHYAKTVMDEVMGVDHYRGEVIWQKLRSVKSQSAHFANMHDVIYVYSKSDRPIFNPQFVEKDPELLKTHYRYTDPETGRRYNLADFTQAGTGPARRFGDTVIAPPPGKHWIWSQERIDDAMEKGLIVFSKGGLPYVKRFFDEGDGTRVGDIWTDINPVNQVALERVDYPTQKPEGLLERIINASSNEGDLVLDCFVGSGTTAVVAEKLGRRWIAADLSRFAIHTTRKRLLALPDLKPFVVQNLGKYERQAWQAGEFGGGGSGEQAAAIQRAYVQFLLQLYGARPLNGYAWLHGVKAGRTVHVGTVDAPVTPGDVTNIVAEYKRAIGTGEDAPTSNAVDVLGWDFAFELHEVAQQQAAAANVHLRFVRIPRDVMDKRAVEQGDIRFFELAALSVAVQQSGRSVTLKLTDFIIPPDDVPEDVRQAVKHWEQWIDYWAVDWDNRSDTFHNQWQSYRTRKEKTLQKQAAHKYDAPSEYAIMVKVIDILGNDTTKRVKVKVG